MTYDQYNTAIKAISEGEFNADLKVRDYARDSLYEFERLFDALWECCKAKDAAMKRLQSIHKQTKRGISTLTDLLNEKRAEIEELRKDLLDAQGDLALKADETDKLRAELVQYRVELAYLKRKTGALTRSE